MSLKIGKIELSSPYILAPMAGYSDCAMRKMAVESGAGLTVTEMVSAKGLLYSGEKSAELLKTTPEEKVKCAQIFGSDPNDFYRVLTETNYLDPFDIIDINMGCPVPKIVKNGEGSALLKDPVRAENIVKACVKGANGRPVTVKTRMGFFEGENIAEEFCKRMENAGASAVTLHARTRAQGYGGEADWSVIEKVKKSLSVPLIGSGDCNETNAQARLSVCDGVMIGRSAVGKVSIFARLLGKRIEGDGREQILKHLDYMLYYYGERYALVNIRKFVGGYFSGERGVREIKQAIFSAKTTEEIKRIIREKT